MLVREETRFKGPEPKYPLQYVCNSIILGVIDWVAVAV